jgi:hypothetical protein
MQGQVTVWGPNRLGSPCILSAQETPSSNQQFGDPNRDQSAEYSSDSDNDHVGLNSEEYSALWSRFGSPNCWLEEGVSWAGSAVFGILILWLGLASCSVPDRANCYLAKSKCRTLRFPPRRPLPHCYKIDGALGKLSAIVLSPREGEGRNRNGRTRGAKVISCQNYNLRMSKKNRSNRSEEIQVKSEEFQKRPHSPLLEFFWFDLNLFASVTSIFFWHSQIVILTSPLMVYSACWYSFPVISCQNYNLRMSKKNRSNRSEEIQVKSEEFQKRRMRGAPVSAWGLSLRFWNSSDLTWISSLRLLRFFFDILKL